MFPLSIFKIFAALIIFLLAIAAGLLPGKFAKKHSHLLHTGDSFARGIFISAALLHMLPDAQENLHSAYPNLHYPLAPLFVVIAFLFLFFIENSVHFLKHKTEKLKLHLSTPYLLALLIMLHSLIEGAAIGINSTLVGISIIFFAVIAHKGFASFALAANLHNYKLPNQQIKKIIILFALMTPVGIFGADILNTLLIQGGGELAQALCNSFAAGTFLYLGAIHSVGDHESIDCHQELWAITLGALLMAAVAIWV